MSEQLVLNNWDQATARLDLSADGSRLAIVGSSKTVVVDLRGASPSNVQTIQYNDGTSIDISDSFGTVYLNDAGTVWRFSLASGELRVIIGSGIRDLVIVDEVLAVVSDQGAVPMQLIDAKSGTPIGAGINAITANAKFVSTRGRTIIIRDGHDSFLFDMSRRELTKLAIEDVTEVEFTTDGEIATLRSLTDVWELNVNNRQSTLVRRISDLRGASRLTGVNMMFILSTRMLEAVDPQYPSAQAGSYEISQEFTGLKTVADNVLMLTTDSVVEFLSFSD